MIHNGFGRPFWVHPPCHDPQCSRACQTYFPWPRTRRIDPGSILAEQHTMPDEATKVGMRNTDAHVCAPSLFSSQRCRWDNNLPHESFVESDSRARMSYH